MATFVVGPGAPAQKPSWLSKLCLAIALLLVGLVTLAALRGSSGHVVQQLRLSSLGGGGSGSGGKPPMDVKPYAGDEVAWPGCQPSKLNLTGLEEYGCKILNNTCFDQNKMLVHNPPDNMEFRYPMFDFGFQPTWVPGWYELDKSADSPGFWQPYVRKNSTEDRSDLKDPIFSSCYTPLVWSSPYHIAFGEFLWASFAPLWNMQTRLKLIDNNIMLVPMLDGYQRQKFMEPLLRPFTTSIIAPFHEVASREHMFDEKYPRCFSTVGVCALEGICEAFKSCPSIYISKGFLKVIHSLPQFGPAADQHRPTPKFFNHEDNDTQFDGDKSWVHFRPALAGRQLVEYYLKQGGIKPSTKPTDLLRIIVANRTEEVRMGVRMFLELDTFLERCNVWMPPAASGFKRVQCAANTFGRNFLQDVELMQSTDILIAHHGGDLSFGLFMPFGTSLVEVRPKGFPDGWGNVYYSSIYRSFNEVLYWQAKVVNESSWVPSRAEKEQRPMKVHERDRNTILRWGSWEPILTRISEVYNKTEEYEQLEYPDGVRWLI